MNHHVRLSRLWPIGMLLAVMAGCASSDRGDPNVARLARLADSELSAGQRDKLLDEADAALNAGKMEDALTIYASVLKHEPKNARAMVGISEVHLAAGDPQRALAGFEQVGDPSPMSAVARQGQGLALIRIGKVEAALKQLDLALAKDEKLWRAWIARAYVHDMAGKWQAADESYRKALTLKSDSPIVHNNRGMSHLLRSRYADAAASFQQALRLDPRLREARANLRVALAWQGKYREAATGVHGSEAATTFNNIGFIAMKKGNYAQAELYFAQAIKASPAHYEKATRNLEYLKQLRLAQTGDGTRAASPPN